MENKDPKNTVISNETKTEVYNLIILDESGSMIDVKAQTISGCNETIDTIKVANRKFGDNQKNYVSIYAFQDGHTPSRYIMKNVPADAVELITEKDYEPCGCTPLYDAVGSTLADLKATVMHKPLAIGSVTIITDGMENSSKEYSHAQVAKMISDLKELGWNFNFIGANIDVEGTARSLNIDNALEFKQDEKGMREMFDIEHKSRLNFSKRIFDIRAEKDFNSCSPEEINKRMKEASFDYFADPDKE